MRSEGWRERLALVGSLEFQFCAARGATQGNGNVLIGTSLGAVLSWSDTQVVASVNAGSATGAVQIQQAGYSSNSVPFTISTAIVSNVSPNNGIAATQVTITGSGFGATQGNGIAWLQ